MSNAHYKLYFNYSKIYPKFSLFCVQILELQKERKNKVTPADNEHQPIVNSASK